MSSECVCDVLAQNTQHVIFYSLLKLRLLGYELKRSDFEYVALNENVLLLLRRGRSFKRSAPTLAVLAFANKHSTISSLQLSKENVLCFKVSHLIVLCIINLRLGISTG